MRHVIGAFGAVAVAFVVGCSSQARPQTSNDAVAILKSDLENSIGTTSLTSAEASPKWDDSELHIGKAQLPAWEDVMPKVQQTWGVEPAEPAVDLEALPETRQ